MCFANKERFLIKMSRKTRTTAASEICGDCGAEPSWASLNRGILLCAECCSVHRSLGRHISQVKSLRQGTWHASVLNYVNALNSSGAANSVWEHCLMDTVAPKNLRRKPTPKESLQIKSDFIRAKHVNLSYVLKPNLQQLDSNDIGNIGTPTQSSLISSSSSTTTRQTINLELELSKQLHASVRSTNLETSLRLLVQGADPNFYHEEKGSTPLHVASKSGQMSQIELLIIYGANICARDSNGNTPIDIAKHNKHFIIAERLLEAQYEVTDRLCYFISGRKPDHSNGQHLLIPDHNHNYLQQNEMMEQLKIARGKLQLIPNRMFEELVMDLYDEVDRREMEAIWITSVLNPDIGGVPFLPTNPHLSATRNQGRQKLARFSPIEFTGLIIDVLLDAKRRQNMATLRPLEIPMMSNLNQIKNQRESNVSDDEPLYDVVASDDDYAALAPIGQQALVNKGPINSTSSIPSIKDFETLRKQLEESISEIGELKTLVKKLACENIELKSRIEPLSGDFGFENMVLHIDDLHINGDENEDDNRNNNKNITPNHINNENEQILLLDEYSIINNSDNSTNNNNSNNNDSNNNNNSNNIMNTINNSNQYLKRPVSMYEPREGLYSNSRVQQQPQQQQQQQSQHSQQQQQQNQHHQQQLQTNSMYNQMPNSSSTKKLYIIDDPSLPNTEEVKLRTDLVTKRIQELWTAMQDLTIKDTFIPCSERIRIAIAELVTIFPSTIVDDRIKYALKQLNLNTNKIQTECTGLQRALLNGDGPTSESFMQEVRNCAYDLAMATKTLVTQFQ